MSAPVVLVTGSSRGIGRAIAQAVAARGARVAVHYGASADAAQETLASLKGDGHRVFQADVADPPQCERLVAEVVAAMGQIDVLVNNAGILRVADLKTTTFAEYSATNDELLKTNLHSAANMTFLCAKHMAAQPQPQPGKCRGKVINISSVAAFGQSARPLYGASKAGVNLMGQTLAQSLGPNGIAFYSIAPTFVATDMTASHLAVHADAVNAKMPTGQIPTTEEAGTIAAFLALDAPFSMTGTTIDLCCGSLIHH
jgi:NAD(P)-dependent dehydrogenase (short-subunit alcohol dehydrogenase family)